MLSKTITLPAVHAKQMDLVYDDNGNLVTGDGFYREYNGFNQLVKIWNGSNASAPLMQEFKYHPREDRVWMKKTF